MWGSCRCFRGAAHIVVLFGPYLPAPLIACSSWHFVCLLSTWHFSPVFFILVLVRGSCSCGSCGGYGNLVTARLLATVMGGGWI